MKNDHTVSRRGEIAVLTTAAAILMVATVWLPIWSMNLKAPQYPGGLRMRAYGDRVEGDLREINILNHYVGMDEIEEVPAPEMALFPVGIALVAALALAAPLSRVILKLAILGSSVFPLAILVDLQWWLHIFGHSLDPHAPLRFIEPFTPLVLGFSKVGNFETWAFVSWGYLTMAAATALLILALRRWPAVEPAPATATVEAS
jgi:hypothetical protein